MKFSLCKHAKFGGRSQGAKGGKVHEFWHEGENLSTSHLLLAGVSTIGLYCHLVVAGGMSREMHPVQRQQIKPDRTTGNLEPLEPRQMTLSAHRSLHTFCKMLPVRLCFASSLHKVPTKTQRCTCKRLASLTQCGPIVSHDDLHRGDYLLGHRRGHGGGVQGTVRVAPQVVNQLLTKWHQSCFYFPNITDDHIHFIWSVCQNRHDALPL